MVAAVGYQLGLLAIRPGHIILNALVVGHNHMGKPHRHRFGQPQHPAGKRSPLLPLVLQPVDVHNHLRPAQQPHHRQEHASRHPQHQQHVVAPQRTAHGKHVVRNALHPVGMQRHILQPRPLVRVKPLLAVLPAAKHRVMHVRRTILANNILHQGLKPAISGRHPLRTNNRNSFHI